MSTITVTQEGILGVTAPGSPNETHILQAPLGGKWTLLGNGTTGDLTATDGASASVDAWGLYDNNGTPWKVTIDESGVLYLTGFDKNILLAPVVNSPIMFNGVPADGYQLFAYQAGGAVSAVTYRNGEFIAEQSIPIILNQFGMPTYPVFVVSGVLYDFALIPPEGGPAIKTWRSLLTGPPSDVSAITQWFAQSASAVRLDVTRFALVGDASGVFRIGRRVQITQSTTLYGMITGSTYDGSQTVVTVTLDSGSLDGTLLSATVGLLSPAYGAIPGRRHILDASYFSGPVTVPLAGGFNLLTSGTMAIVLKPIPAGWLECNGQAISRTTYAALFASISTTFGAGDGSTTFNVPTIATTGMGANSATTTSINAGNFVYAIYAQG
jgi:hypothetical protein